MKQTKKGFTLVELLVVIAILAILATVSVVGYTSFIQRAHESNDKTLVAQLNLAVTRVDGKEYESMYDVVNAVKEQGFDIAKMQATAADQAILWDMEEQRFFYSADEQHEGANVWVVSDEVSETYNTYYIGSAEIKTSASTTICIATEGGNLTVNAPNANVEHYGEVANLNIDAVANNSYHEFGRVTGIATVASGRVVVEESGVIGTIVVKVDNTVKLEGSFGVVIAPEGVDYETAENFTVNYEATATPGEINDSAICNTTTGEFYETFEEAFKQESGTLLLLQQVDVVLEKGYTIDSGKTFVIDLNGHEFKCEGRVSANFDLIINNGSLTIKDSVGGGKISLHATSPDLDAIPSYASNIITNCGTLVIESGTIENTTDAPAAYCVDNKAIFTMNGGSLEADRCALRIMDNNEFYMNGGTIAAPKPAWIQLSGRNAAFAPKISVQINGGVLQSTNPSSADNNIIYTYSNGNSHGNTDITINGGQFLGGTVTIGWGYYGDAPKLTINGGTFEYDVLKATNADETEVIYEANK